MRLAIIDRRKNSVVSSEPVEDSQNPLIPPPDTIIRHHIRFDFFQTSLRNRALWLTRLDKQSAMKKAA
jgi:hypothetical protein